MFTRYLLLITYLSAYLTNAQAPKKPSAAEIFQGIKKLNVCGTALYLAAHPDDENTNVIAVLSNEKLLNTAYLSLTRGDGGQNLIGTEQGDLLGIIRTQELLQARRVDGGKQFFTRARDFGFSKLPDETFTIWDKEKVLADVVWVIRNLKPDIIITRFSLEPGRTHGHHTASAMLGVEAFDIAADKSKFPEQLTFTSTWQPYRIVWNSSRWFYGDEANMLERKPIKLECGNYNSLLGKSYNEISAESRSMHKSQGFGTMGNRGSNFEYFEHLKGPKAEKDILEGIDFTWNRVPGGASIIPLVNKAITEFKIESPEASVSALIQIYKAIQKLPDSHYKIIKLQETQNLIKACLGIFVEVTAPEFSATPGETIKLNIEAINRSRANIDLTSLKIADFNKDTTFFKNLEDNKSVNTPLFVTLPASVSNSQPYWLNNKGSLGMYEINDQKLIGQPVNPGINLNYSLNIEGVTFTYETPVVFKKSDPVEGEIYRPFEIHNPVFLNTEANNLMFAEDKPKDLKVTVRAGKNNVSGDVVLELPSGWKAEPAKQAYNLRLKGQEQDVFFKLYPPKEAGTGSVKIKTILDGKEYSQGYISLQHKHIPTQVYFPEATVKVVKLDIAKKGEKIGYIMGAGDEIPKYLEQIGYKVSLLKDAEINEQNLKSFDAIILGVRAFNTIERMKFHVPKLFNYVKNGGNLIVQYNTNGRLQTDTLAPFKLKLSGERVTVEQAPVKFLKPEHPVLNVPNKITDKDFEGWVQERGLYFANEWGKEFEAILSCNDPGEPAREGGLLIAKYGKGNYIYTGYSWFRELPAGVPGAYRLFVNLISLGKK